MTARKSETTVDSSAKTLPVLAVRNMVLFPGATVPLNIGRPRSVAAVEAARQGDNTFIVVAQRHEVRDREPGPRDLYSVGTVCRIEHVRGDATHGFQALVRGTERVRIEAFHESGAQAHLSADTSPLADVHDIDDRTEAALASSTKQLAAEILALVPGDTRQVEELIKGLDDLGLLTNLCAEYLEEPVATKQELLETLSTRTRTLKLLELMQRQKESLQLQSEIREKLSSKMGKLQREAILREQMKTIREELGDDETGRSDDEYTRKIEESGMPADIRKVAEEETRRLASMGSSSPESHVIKNYLDLLCAMPWTRATTDSLDLDSARKVLDEDHYGLEKIKKRVVQHLAMLKLKASAKGSILLFVGPPGVGKTSLGQSVARALGRKFVRVSLGGVRDDAEIRGHRRTYIGAMPGRIVQGIKRAGVRNPVLMLDEIDKLGRGYSGDPAAALLEVLDPEQNMNFHDHYLDVPFDLSDVFFICTANSLDSIPGPLRDRMEIIELSGYTTAEKVHIAKRHLIPHQLESHGITPAQVRISDEALLRIIANYTREAGVRELQRRVSEVLRGMTEKVVTAGAEAAFRIRPDDLTELLGPQRFEHEVAERVTPPGVVTGLAWTPVGGEILFIEASLMPGTGKLTITGQLGDVMRESAQIALSLARVNLAAVAPDLDLDKRDIHIHVPSGAIPKDGPSAGIAMLTTLASLLSGRRVSPTVAMTGEITLRGAVMPVGGIKEKLIAAHRAGIQRVLLPRRNEKDLFEVPEEVKAALKIDLVDTARDVLREALDLEIPETVFRGTADATPHLPSPASMHQAGA